MAVLSPVQVKDKALIFIWGALSPTEAVERCVPGDDRQLVSLRRKGILHAAPIHDPIRDKMTVELHCDKNRYGQSQKN